MEIPTLTLADIRRASCPKHFKDASCGDCPILYECCRGYSVDDPYLMRSILEKAKIIGVRLASELLQDFLRLPPSERQALFQALQGGSSLASTHWQSHRRTF